MDNQSNITIEMPSEPPKVEDLDMNEVFAFMLPAMDAIMRPLTPNEPQTKPSIAYYSAMYSTVYNLCTTSRFREIPLAVQLSKKLDDYFIQVASQYHDIVQNAVDGIDMTDERYGDALLHAYRTSWTRYATFSLPYLANVYQYFERSYGKRPDDVAGKSLLSEEEQAEWGKDDENPDHEARRLMVDRILQPWTTSNLLRNEDRSTLINYARAAQSPESVGGIILIAFRRWRTEVIEKLVEDGRMAKLVDHLTSLPVNGDTSGVCEEIETSLLRSGVDPEGETLKALRVQISAIQAVG